MDRIGRTMDECYVIARSKYACQDAHFLIVVTPWINDLIGFLVSIIIPSWMILHWCPCDIEMKDGWMILCYAITCHKYVHSITMVFPQMDDPFVHLLLIFIHVWIILCINAITHYKYAYKCVHSAIMVTLWVVDICMMHG